MWLVGRVNSFYKKTTKELVDLYVFEKNLSKDNQEKLKKIVENSNIQIVFKEITDNFDFYIPKQWPLPSVYRLIADSVLSDLDKVIYLDIDTLVYKYIKDLWKINLGDNYLAACYGLDVNKKLDKVDSECKVKNYFNSGVLLMNLRQMRKDKIGKKCIDMLKKFNTLLHAPDQDVLNIVCAQKIKPLAICWNWYVSIARRSQKNLKKIFGVYLSSEPSIIHFYSRYKGNRFFIYLTHPIATYRIWKQEKFFWECLDETDYRMPHEIKVKF